MYHGKSIAVVVPAFNEQEHVGEVIDDIPAFVDRLYVVDDCSTDDTWDTIQRHVQKANRERTPVDHHSTHGGVRNPVTNGGVSQWAESIRHEENTGVGGAIKTGYRRALEDEIDVTAVINGDGQMDPDILDRIIEPVVDETAVYAKGNRLLSSELRSGMTAWRLFGNTVLTLLTKFASGYWKVQDPQNGYTAISSEALEAIDLDSLYDRYGFLNDVLVTLNAHGLPVADVRMQAVYGDEESNIEYSRFIPRVSRLLLRNFVWRLKRKYLLRDFHPLVFFYSVGVLAMLGSFFLAMWGAITAGPIILFGALALIMSLSGVGFVLFAMVFDMRHNEHLEHRYYS